MENMENTCYLCNLKCAKSKTSCCNNYYHYTCLNVYAQFIGCIGDCAICGDAIDGFMDDLNMTFIIESYQKEYAL
jgi:hypothetical protein